MVIVVTIGKTLIVAFLFLGQTLPTNTKLDSLGRTGRHKLILQKLWTLKKWQKSYRFFYR